MSDNDIPFPKAADRKELQNLVKDNWQSAVQEPYQKWDTDRLQAYLKDAGHDVASDAQANKDSLVKQVKGSWYESGDQAQSAYESLKDWVFDRYVLFCAIATCTTH